MTTVAPVAVPVTDPSGNPVTGKISLFLFYFMTCYTNPNKGNINFSIFVLPS